MDHGLDEDKVWAFRMTAYNQSAVINRYAFAPFKAIQASNVPFWGMKLATPVFYTEEKYTKFLKQWKQRVGLEMIKIRQAIDLKPGDATQRKSNKYEIQKYLNDVYQSQIDESMADVYVTDHKAKTE